MSLLKSLEKLIGVGQHLQAPQSHPAQGQQMQVQPSSGGVLGNNTPQAHAYNANPMASHADPAQFGYPADARLGDTAGIPHSLLVGASNMQQLPQGGQFNPGYSPLQNSRFGAGGNPQIGAFARPQLNQVNPQLHDKSYFWN